MSSIADVMVTEAITARPDESVHAAARRMANQEIGALVVTEGDRVVGVLSERDVMSRVVAEGLDSEGVRVGEVATSEVVTVEASAPVREVLELFRTHRVRHVPVLREGRLAGILSVRDFLEFLVSGLEHLIDEQRYRQELAEGRDPYDHFGGSYGR